MRQTQVIISRLDYAVLLFVMGAVILRTGNDWFATPWQGARALLILELFGLVLFGCAALWLWFCAAREAWWWYRAWRQL